MTDGTETEQHFSDPAQKGYTRIRRFYDEVYYRDARGQPGTDKASGHLRRLARRLGVGPGTRVLDVGCGTCRWLSVISAMGGEASGIDISEVAVEVCREALPDARIEHGPAETLPFPPGTFDLVTCLGSLEHFLDPVGALREIKRVATPQGRILLLVPNAGFLTRQLGLYGGTWQADVEELVLTLDEWGGLFETAGLHVLDRWRDIHVLSRPWITRGPPYLWPIRLAQAVALTVWPLKWQYQVHHLCAASPAPGPGATGGRASP